MTNSRNSSPSPLVQLPNTYRAFYGGFVRLHPFQTQAIGPILDGCDLILQSATGSGKTEAVLAPCMERVIRSGRDEAVLYVVPTRALAIDLERRLTPILSGRLGLQFAIRTGDTKRAGGARPDLMLTTPESLDVLMGSSNAALKQFVQRIRMVIIDEVHPLVRQYRGEQLVYLLRRLERRTGRPLQRIALSATISDVDATVSFFNFRADTVRLISSVQREIEPNLVYLRREEDELISLLDDLHRVWRYRKILMFANSRGQCDRLFGMVSRKGPFRRVAEIHYSNLKPRERRAAEDRFRRHEHALIVATSTLELGIDVGDVDAVILFEPPDSVSSFLQRIGRSNRRGAATRLWGICRGELAGNQVVRFAGLLRLARQGAVEVPLAGALPSVLVQQVLSCLYEKKYVSLTSMQKLFAECRERLGVIFPNMERLGWLRADHLHSLRRNAPRDKRRLHGRGNVLFHGGWRYRDALLERRIWSNFPETEEDYGLEISGESVADLPRSIVRQLEPGDRVHLAGRRIRILQIIDFGERKRVLAEPAEELDEKEILWLGMGFQVSFEVAQSMRSVLSMPEESIEPADLGLFTRTSLLLEEEMKKAKRCVTLVNGIEVHRETTSGFYGYRTFLGSLGNLILRLTVEKQLGTADDVYVTSNEIGITCSHWIDFQRLELPQGMEGFRRWVSERLRQLRALLPLNAFADALPDALLVEELTGFIYDGRVSENFTRYLTTPSEIVSGDPALLELAELESKPLTPVFLQPSASPLLLALEKERWSNAEQIPLIELVKGALHVLRPLTGTMIGEYMRHQQCERWLSFQFLPSDRQPRVAARNVALEDARTERGRRHERSVLHYIRQTGARFFTIEETDILGAHRSLPSRFNETLHRLEQILGTFPSPEPCYLSQPVLMAPFQNRFTAEIAEYAEKSAEEKKKDHKEGFMVETEGVGIPDLIHVSLGGEAPLLQVGDIKDSRAPYYSQKWQVAFYSFLLRECIENGLLAMNCRVSNTGFLILRQSRGSSAPLVHSFDLEPFIAAFPALFQNIREALSKPPAKATERLQEHCTTCPYFEFCYRQALHEEDIQFLPGLSEGELWKMRHLGLATMQDAEMWLD